MRDRQAPLPPIAADCHRLLPVIIMALETSRYGDKDIRLWLFRLWPSKYLNQWCFDLRSLVLSLNALFIVCSNFMTGVNGMQDSPYLRKLEVVRYIFNSLAPWQNGHNPGDYVTHFNDPRQTWYELHSYAHSTMQCTYLFRMLKGMRNMNIAFN